MRVFIFVIFLSISFSSIVYAQHEGLDSVYLDSGNLIIGKINPSSTTERIVIKTADNKIHTYMMTSVYKIFKSHTQVSSNDTIKQHIESTENKDDNKVIKTEPVDQTPTLKTIDKSYLIINAGYAIGLNSESFNVYKIDLIGSYNISKSFNFGVGTGYRKYVSKNGYAKVIPLYVDLRFLLDSYRNYSFFALDLGYSSEVTESFYPLGYYVSPSFNLCSKIGNSSFISFGIGCELQKADNYNIRGNLLDLFFNIGFMF